MQGRISGARTLSAGTGLGAPPARLVSLPTQIVYNRSGMKSRRYFKATMTRLITDLDCSSVKTTRSK